MNTDKGVNSDRKLSLSELSNESITDNETELRNQLKTNQQVINEWCKERIDELKKITVDKTMKGRSWSYKIAENKDNLTDFQNSKLVNYADSEQKIKAAIEAIVAAAPTYLSGQTSVKEDIKSTLARARGMFSSGISSDGMQQFANKLRGRETLVNVIKRKYPEGRLEFNDDGTIVIHNLQPDQMNSVRGDAEIANIIKDAEVANIKEPIEPESEKLGGTRRRHPRKTPTRKTTRTPTRRRHPRKTARTRRR